MTILELQSALTAARAKIYVPHTDVTYTGGGDLAVHTDGRFVYIEGEAAAQLALETPPQRTDRLDGSIGFSDCGMLQVTNAGVRLYEFVASLPAILRALSLSETLVQELQKALKEEREAHARTRAARDTAERAARDSYPFPPNTRVYRDFPSPAR